MDTLLNIYFSLLFLCVVYSSFLSIKYGLKKTNYIFIYFFAILLVELSIKIIYQFNSTIQLDWLYNYLCIFSVFYFGLFYWEIVPKKYKRKVAFITILFILIIAFFTKFYAPHFSNKLAVVVSFYFIILTIFWFYIKLNSVSLEPILLDPAFWINCALLFWSIFFVFRITPRYFFEESDQNFLNVLKTIFLVVVLIEYTLFFISLLTYNKVLRSKTK